MLTRSASRARASSRTLTAAEAATAVSAARAPRRGMSFDTYNSQETDAAAEANRAHRNAHYRYLESLSQQRARESMEKAMASSMNAGPRAPRRRNTTYDASAADPLTDPSLQDKYQQELWTNPKEVTPEEVINATTSGHAPASHIDPITNRRVPKKTPKRANTLPIQPNGGEDVLSSWFTPGLRQQAATADVEPKKYSDLDKYGPVYWNEPDGLRKQTPEELSKRYEDLHHYAQRTPIRREFDDAPIQPEEATFTHYPETGASASGRKPMLRDFDEPTKNSDLDQYAAPIGSRSGAAGGYGSSSTPFGNGFSNGSSSGVTPKRTAITREHDGRPENVPSGSMKHLSTDALNRAYEQYHEFEPASSLARKQAAYDGFGSSTARLYREASGLAGSLAEAEGKNATADMSAEDIRSNVLRRVRERSQQKDLEEARARHQSEWKPVVEEAISSLDGESGEFYSQDFHRLDSDHVILSQVLKESSELRGLPASEARYRSEWDPAVDEATANLAGDKVTLPRDTVKDMSTSETPLSSRVQGENQRLASMNKDYQSEWQPEINAALEEIKLEPRPDGDRDAFTRFTLENIQKDMTTPLSKIADPVNKVPLAAKVAGQEQKFQDASDNYRSQWDPVTSKATEELAEQYGKHSKSPVRRLPKTRVTDGQHYSQDNKQETGGLDAAESHRAQWEPAMKESHETPLQDHNDDGPLMTLNGNYARDFPEEFSTSWSAGEDAVLRPTKTSTTTVATPTKANDNNQEPEVSSMDESFPINATPTRLEWSLDRVSSQAARANAEDTTVPAPEVEQQQPPSPRSYKVLAYDVTTDSMHVAETLSTAEDSAVKSPSEVLTGLSHPAKFLPYLSTLQAEGYEMVSGGDKMVVFRQTAGAPSGQTAASAQRMPKKKSVGRKVVVGTAYVAGSAYAVGVVSEYFGGHGQ